ncbi:acyloxyacyl hydrolase [Salinarimonas soli]|uniref:Acyloxyacyl hydrolase n=1 Tax=Salinarimonas soli TaxID=1638099 RepID=A0A5B2V9R5_9HYPH|nr:acyloxyacyl hydrolase [Salinarimonas soli]KAA2235468.1 acyloxyacyl hydrolase [Salinarimonas soli]
MRLAGLALGIAIAQLAAGAAIAADVARRPAAPQPMPVPVALQPSFISEVRFGAFAHDPWSPEAGSANLHAEVLFAKPFTPADLFTSYFVPRPHIGASLNLGDATSFAFAGLTWTVDVTERVFVEASFGGAIHNGETGRVIPADRSALGCSPLFRESASIGFRLSQNWNVMATVEHLSNAGICNQNRGLTNIGARFGYSF